MTHAKKESLKKETKFSISIGLAIILAGGIWTLSVRVHSWEVRLDRFEEKINDRWTYQMERELWQEVALMNLGFKVPNVSQIRNEHTRR